MDKRVANVSYAQSPSEEIDGGDHTILKELKKKVKRKEGALVCLPNQRKLSQRDGFMEGLAMDMHAAMSTLLCCLSAPLVFCKTAAAIRLCTSFYRITWNSHCDKKIFRITPYTDKPPGTSSVDEA